MISNLAKYEKIQIFKKSHDEKDKNVKRYYSK